MKKIISVFLTICMLISVCAAGTVYVFADSEKIDGTDITFSYDPTDESLNFEGTGEIPDYEDYRDGYGGVELKYPWKDIAYKKITFSDGITGIGNYAFCYSTKLESVEFPSNVTSLGEGVFLYCTSLKSVVIPDGITEVGKSLFENCHSLESVTFAPGTKEIGDRAFFRCTSLKTVELPETLEKIGAYSFDQCSMLESIAVPDKTAEIGAYAFYTCEAMTSLDLGGAVSIGRFAFSGCSALKEIIIPEGTEAVSDNEFEDCSGLENVTLPDSLLTIGSNAFNFCNSLKAVTIPQTVTSIGTKAVGYGSRGKLTEGFVISGYTNTEAQNYALGNSIKFEALGHCTIGSCGEKITWSYDVDTATLTLTGEGATYDFSAEKHATYVGLDIQKIELDERITGIGSFAFFNCQAGEITLSERITDIGEKGVGYYSMEKIDEESGELVTVVTKMDSFVINGHRHTKASEYAELNEIKFNSLDPEPVYRQVENAPLVIDEDIIKVYATELTAADFEGMFECANCTISISSESIATGTVITFTDDQGYKIEEFTVIVNGDVSGDSFVNSTDALLILQHSVGLITLEGVPLRAADINGDGEINSSDALLILRLSVGSLTQESMIPGAEIPEHPENPENPGGTDTAGGAA